MCIKELMKALMTMFLCCFLAILCVSLDSKDDSIMQPSPEIKIYDNYLSKQGFSLESVDMAVAEYKKIFRTSSQKIKDKGFVLFYDYHIRMIRNENAVLDNYLLRASCSVKNSSSSPNSRLSVSDAAQIIAEKNKSPDYISKGIEAVYAGEGEWAHIGSIGFYELKFDDYLSSSVKEFLLMDYIEGKNPYAMDGGICIPLDDLAGRAANWERYAIKFPESVFVSMAKFNFKWRFSAYILGCDNSPIYDRTTKKIRPKLLESYRMYITKYPENPSSKIVSDVVSILEKRGFIIDDESQNEILSAAGSYVER